MQDRQKRLNERRVQTEKVNTGKVTNEAQGLVVASKAMDAMARRGESEEELLKQFLDITARVRAMAAALGAKQALSALDRSVNAVRKDIGGY